MPLLEMMVESSPLRLVTSPTDCCRTGKLWCPSSPSNTMTGKPLQLTRPRNPHPSGEHLEYCKHITFGTVFTLAPTNFSGHIPLPNQMHS